ncbi:MAG: hypothetical protein JOZ99_15765, partial [Actinobacteria bacterium]|nr:hypothetical protein [Actinomycetota bacterium]
MPPIPAARRFEIICGALALAEERNGIPLDDAAKELHVDVDQLRALLDPVLYLEFRTADGELVEAARAFLLNNDDVLTVDEGNWLRDLASDPPDPVVALRLLVAASVYQATTSRIWQPLDRALAKLRQYVAIELVLPVDHPDCLDTALEANRKGRSLRFRYLKWKAEKAS